MAKRTPPTPDGRQDRVDAVARDGGRGANRTVVGAVVATVAIIAVVGAVVEAERDEAGRNTAERLGSSQGVPAGAGAMGEGFVANADVTLRPGAPTVDVYEDFQCPACAHFEQVMGGTLTDLAGQGRIRVVYHLKTFLDANLGTTHSLTMGNAAMCAADAGAFQAFHDVVYANMPAHQGEGWSSAQLTAFAREAGVTGTDLATWEACVDERRYTAYVESTEESSSRAGVNATPTVRLAGAALDLDRVSDPAGLVAAVEAATP